MNTPTPAEGQCAKCGEFQRHADYCQDIPTEERPETEPVAATCKRCGGDHSNDVGVSFEDLGGEVVPHPSVATLKTQAEEIAALKAGAMLTTHLRAHLQEREAYISEILEESNQLQAENAALKVWKALAEGALEGLQQPATIITSAGTTIDIEPCSVPGCVRVKGHPSFHCTIDKLARLEDGR